MVFPVVMYGGESWTVKKAECQRIDAFELWCWRRLFRVPWTVRRSNHSILKEISPDGSHAIKTHLLLGRNPMKNLDKVLKSRCITLPPKVYIVKSMVFPVVMYGWESWTLKKAEHQRIDAFELWCWRRLLRVPWTVRTSNQSILKEISPEYSLEGLMLKLKPQYFGHLI